MVKEIVMKAFAFFIPVLLLGTIVMSQDNAAIKQTALDYAEGFYSGDAVRMERAIHPDLNKAFPRLINRTGKIVPAYNAYSQLIEITRSKAGVLADSLRHLSVEIINVDDNVANVKILSANFNDFVQMIKV